MLGIILAGMRHRPVRTLTGIFTVAISMAVVTLTVGGIRRAQQAVQAPDFWAVTSANIKVELPVSYATRAASVPGVESVDYMQFHLALDGSPQNEVIGTLAAASEGYLRMEPSDMVHLDPEVEARWRGEKQAMAASPFIAAKMGWTPGASVNLTWRTTRGGDPIVTPFHFVGSYRGQEPDLIFVHYDYVDELLPPAERGRMMYMGVFRKEDQQASVDQAVDQLLRQMPEASKSGPSHEWLTGIVSTELALTSLLERLVAGMLAITAAIVGAGVAMSLRERQVEIGTLRAIGFKRGQVFWLIVGESAVTAFAGYALGVLIPTAVLALRGRGIDLGSARLADIRPGQAELLLGAAAAAVLTVGISIWPALSAARRDVVDVLQEG